MNLFYHFFSDIKALEMAGDIYILPFFGLEFAFLEPFSPSQTSFQLVKTF